MKFEGYDWTELGNYWKIKDEGTEEEFAAKIKQYMLERCDWYDKRKMKRVANAIRRFLKVLIMDCERNGDESHYVWEGLLLIRNDEVLIKFTVELLECMWS